LTTGRLNSTWKNLHDTYENKVTRKEIVFSRKH